jgi:hypothetical protein
VTPEDLPSGPRTSGASHHDLPGRTGGPKQRRIEHVRAGWWPAIRMTPSFDSKPSISDQQLVEGLLPLVVSAAEPGAPGAGPTASISFDEDDAGRVAT